MRRSTVGEVSAVLQVLTAAGGKWKRGAAASAPPPPAKTAIVEACRHCEQPLKQRVSYECALCTACGKYRTTGQTVSCFTILLLRLLSYFGLL